MMTAVTILVMRIGVVLVDTRRRDAESINAWSLRCAANARGEQPRRANASRRSARLRGSTPRYQRVADSEREARSAYRVARPSLDDPVRPQEHRLGDRQPQRFGGLEVDHQLERRRLLDWEVGSLGALEDLVHVGGRPPPPVRAIWLVSQETTGLRLLTQPGHRREAAPCRVVCDSCSVIGEHRVIEKDDGAGLFPGHLREGPVDLAGVPRLQGLKPYAQWPGRILHVLHPLCVAGIGRIPEEGHPRDLGHDLFEQLQLLPEQLGRHHRKPRDVSSGRARLATNPAATGSADTLTMGILSVASFAAWIAG